MQFSGGEPTLSPCFLESIAYARTVGYFSVQCATNGVRFAQDPDFAHRARAAGLRLAYLQFDGIGNEKNAHRAVKNLFDVKLKAIEALHGAGIDVTLVVTVVNSINNDQIGSIIRFAIENIDKINAVSFQPVSFTGRDERLDPETRTKWRYTLSHLAHDVKAQTGVTEPLRDWYPLSASGPISDFTDQLRGLESQWGNLKCGCPAHRIIYPPQGPVTRALHWVSANLARIAAAEPNDYATHHMQHHAKFGADEDAEFLNFVKPRRYWLTFLPLAFEFTYGDFIVHRPLALTRGRLKSVSEGDRGGRRATGSTIWCRACPGTSN